ncbi:hypothetical protein RVR34_24240 [Microcystis aeruginosa FBCC-A68]|uniref:hypothetical protein n=1 Tax=Microcystis aeruginosa TaxID=1126 RepID=UPI001482786A|nr:hypothetical protein [Microcystis aeruginosa]
MGKWGSCLITLSPYHPITLSPYHPITPKPYHPKTLSPQNPITPKPCLLSPASRLDSGCYSRKAPIADDI